MRELSDQEIERARAAAKEGAKEAVHEAFAEIGFDLSTNNGRIEAQETFSFLRDWKAMCLLMRRQGVIGLTMAFVSGLVAMFVFAMRNGWPGK